MKSEYLEVTIELNGQPKTTAYEVRFNEQFFINAQEAYEYKEQYMQDRIPRQADFDIKQAEYDQAVKEFQDWQKERESILPTINVYDDADLQMKYRLNYLLENNPHKQ